MSTSLVLPGMPPAPPPAVRLSFSRVDTYRQCPLRYRFAYVDQLPTRPSPTLSWGSSIHAALRTWWDQKLPQAPPVDVLLTALYHAWDDEGFGGMARDDKLRWYRHAQDVLRRHHDRYAPSFVPAVACEQWFELDLGDNVSVAGSIDHVARTPGGGIGIVDWKTHRKAGTREQVGASLQLAIYTAAAAHLWGQEPQWVALDFVVPGVRVTVPRDQIDTAAAVAAIRDVASSVREELFPPSPSPLCGWCDFRAACPAFAGEGPDVAGAAVVELRKLRRRAQRDATRIDMLEHIIRERLGPEALLEVGGILGPEEGAGR